MTDKIKKATTHTNQNEGLIFEKSSTGKRAFELPPLDVPAADPAKTLGISHRREGVEGFPEVSEIEVIRHFTRLSTWNYAIDLGMYPLGSCTMKYNPRVNEFVARLDGLATEHPLQPTELSQGCLRILRALELFLLEVTGMDAITLQPCAGAQGEYAGIAMIRAYLESRGDRRKKVLVPDSAHGTNPATAVTAGYEVLNIRSDSTGRIDMSHLAEYVSDDVAALMVTNPNTLGIFEQDIARAAELVHARGALLYMDGANMNALAGVARPGDFGVDVMHMNLHKTFSTPHGGGGPGAGPVAVKKHLEPFLPIPRLKNTAGGWELESNRPASIGRLRSFQGNFGMLVRAYTYILALGGDGLAQASKLAILNANYVRKRLEDKYPCASTEPSMHECVLTHDLEKSAHVSTLEIAKRLLDYGMHPPTIYFPLVVPGALMIEPTETEGKETLDGFIAAMEAIHHEAINAPDLVKHAPHTLPLRRV